MMANWWHVNYNELLSQLPPSIQNHLKKRIETTTIRGRKCKLNEACSELEDLFEKEVESYKKKKKIRTATNASINKENQVERDKELEELRKQLQEKDTMIEKLEEEKNQLLDINSCCERLFPIMRNKIEQLERRLKATITIHIIVITILQIQCALCVQTTLPLNSSASRWG